MLIIEQNLFVLLHQYFNHLLQFLLLFPHCNKLRYSIRYLLVDRRNLQWLLLLYSVVDGVLDMSLPLDLLQGCSA